MISVIICSANAARAADVTRNITATIGVPHELIVIDNAKALGGMCAGNNAGAQRAVYDICCFVHDDVAFLTNDWGTRVIAHFNEDEQLALIGLAGSRYKSKTLSGWYTGLQEADCCNIYQRKKNGKDRQFYMRPEGMEGKSVQVKTLDGVWLCMRKQVWQKHPFNSERLNGFHFYDLDISLRVSSFYKVSVVYDVDVSHFSKGNFGDEWVLGAINFHENVNKVTLPCSVDGVISPQWESAVIRAWLRRLSIEKISFKNKKLWCRAAGASGLKEILPFYFNFYKRLKVRLRRAIKGS
ncbi:Glycosyltransferase like family protein [Chitinophaga sp. CF118]|uniref:glycosyltransferase n=1 Tax=Chitinophaga sp. CF118 TaxID=1884367 RepID=UPI0008EACB8A|nr:glycosyltransferase [Chitinophaga sp. CF118]SFD81763.1 Glycosyltransferase like family protein [Chitinophaga sp. CF118]